MHIVNQAAEKEFLSLLNQLPAAERVAAMRDMLKIASAQAEAEPMLLAA